MHRVISDYFVSSQERRESPEWNRGGWRTDWRKSIRRGLKVLTIEDFPDWLGEIIKKRETRDMCKFSGARPQLRNQRLHLLGAGDTSKEKPRGRNSIAQGDLTLCIVHWIYIWKVPRCEPATDSRTSNIGSCVFVNNLIFIQQSLIRKVFILTAVQI